MIRLLILFAFLQTLTAQQAAGVLEGTVADESGGVLLDVSVVLIDAREQQRVTATNQLGEFRFSDLRPGIYTLNVEAEGFSPYQNFVQIGEGAAASLTIAVHLEVAVQQEEVTVESEVASLSLSSEETAGAIVLRGEDLDALPDDSEELAEALQALAGPSAGPNGGQFYVDGFSGGRLPPKASIREIRINQNPFSSEFERIGFGRVEIFTRPGTEEYRGELQFNFNDESLNSRNPFAPNRAPFQSRRYSANFGGPLIKGKASFFVDFDQRSIDENAVINARVLDSGFQAVSFSEALVTPQRRTSFSPRFDYQLSQNHTLTTRYSYWRNDREDEGIGQFSLPSRAYDVHANEHEFSLTETAVLGPTMINETRFQYERDFDRSLVGSTEPTIQVLDAFTGGGPQVGNSTDRDVEWELYNATSWTTGAHSLKAGAELEYRQRKEISRNNFAGSFTFGGGQAPELDANNSVVVGPDGMPVLVPISSLERYRRTLLFLQQGLNMEQIRALGGGPLQFSLAAGDPLAAVGQAQLGAFFQDDWRVRPDFMISLGLRYETQNNIDDHLDFAPRVAFAWSPGAGSGTRPSTVIRGGAGVFYDRFGETLTLQARRFNGVNQQQFVVASPSFFPEVPPLEELQAAALPQVVRRIDETLQNPYSIQSALSLERQLPAGFTMTVSYVNMRTLHALRSRVATAEGTAELVPGVDRIYEYVSDGRFNQNQLIVGVNNRFSSRFTLFSNYTLGRAKGNTDGAGSFPAVPGDLNADYSRSSFDVRHRLFVGGSVTLPWSVRLNPFVIASSGRPFNITTGLDNNGDTIFADRPAFATDPTDPEVIVTRLGAFDPTPEPGQALVERNFGQGPGFFLVNLRLSKVFGFGGSEESASEAPGGPPPGRWAGGGRGRGRGGFRGGSGGGGSSGSRYNLTFSVSAQNLLNRTNYGPVIGNLSSPLFGESNSTGGSFGGRGGSLSSAGNRRVEFQLRFSF